MLPQACELAARSHNAGLDPDVRSSALETEAVVAETRAMEEACQRHMDNPEESEEEPEPAQEDDITVEDFVQWGCRRVLD